MDVTLRDLVTNPPGKNTRQVGARYMIRDALTAKFRESFMDPNKRKKYGVAVTRNGNDVFTLWVRVPSEKYDVIYDVILQLSFDEGVKALSNANVQLYCNSPGWVFPVGYVAATQGLLIPGWEKALGRAAVEPPSSLNPNAEYGFDKTTYRAFLYITGPGGLVTINDLKMAPIGTAPDPKDARLSAEYKLHEYNRAKDKYDAVARTVKRAERQQKLEAERKEKAAKRATSNHMKAASAARATKSARTAANAGRRKTRTSK
jgi:hypothetical protein